MSSALARPIPVKGLPDPIEIFELTGAGTARTRLQAAVLRGLTRFVGRAAEVEHLRRVLGQASAGHGQVVAIVGEAGVGKSRLVYEFTHSHRVQDWLILEASSVSYGKATSYVPVIGLLKGYFQIGDRDDHREMRAKVLGRVLGLDRALEPLLPPLLALLDVPVEDPPWQTLDPPQRRQRTLDAIKRLLLRETQVQPLLVVFEDLHWIDGETQALLDNLVESLGSARLLLLVNYRPEYEHRWGSKTAYSQLRLDTLPTESAAELLAALLGPDPGLAPLTEMLVKRGNPFFLEETVRTLVETGALAGERGAYRLTRPVEALQVPATVQAILAARIDRLPPEEKRLLQAASVIGKDVPYALLAAIAEQPEEALRRGLAHLQEGEFLYETQLFPDLEHTFKHALTHDVAYAGLLGERRRALHAAVAATIEHLHADRLVEHVERLAHHAVRGELWEQAVAYLRQAGVKALARSGSREAAAAFEQAMAALPHLPEGRATVEQGIDLRFELRQALQALGEHQRVVDYLGEAEALAATLDDQRRLGWASAYLSQYFALLGEPERAVEAGQRALTIGGASGDFGLQVSAHFFLGQLSHWSGDYQRAKAHLHWNVDALTEDRVHERFGQSGLPAVMSRSLLAWGMAELGEFTEAAAYADEAIQIAEFVGQPYSLLMAYLILGYLHLAKGDAERALPPLQRALALYETWNLAFFFHWIAQGLGLAYARGDLHDEAMPLLKRAIAHLPALLKSQRAPLHTTLGEVYLLAGRPDAADEEARRALAGAQECRTRGSQAWALRLLGEVAARRDPPGHAEGHYRDALVLAEELGMRPLVAHCHLGLGKLSRRVGKDEQAHEHLTTATTMYREMDMRFYLEQAIREVGG
jgi:tetratricopeptide (TPR) repeat protein